MTLKVPYSEVYEPPAPVLPVRLGSPSGGSGVHLVALVDTGADVTVMPIVVVESLSLPIVSTTRVVGVSGASRANIHAAFLEAAGSRTMAEVVALGAEAILGRDMANHWILALDGPGRLLEVRPGPRRARRR